MTGRQMSEDHSRDPQCHVIRQLIPESPLIYLTVRYSHTVMGCNRAISTYKNHINMAGYNSTNL